MKKRLFFVLLALVTSLRATVTITFHSGASYNAATGIFVNNLYYLNWSKTETFTDPNNNSATRNEVRTANSDGTWNPSGTLIHSDNYGQAASGSTSGNFEYANRKFGIRTYTQNTVAGVQTVTFTFQLVEFDAAPPEPKYYHIKFTNTSAVPVKYDVIKNGTTTVETVTVPPFTWEMLKTYSGTDTDTFQPVGSLTDYVFENGAWITVPDAITSFAPVDAAGVAYQTAFWDAIATGQFSLDGVGGAAPPATGSNSIPVVTPSSLPTSVPVAGASPVWSAPTGATADGERLDKATYRQGIDKTVLGVKAVETKLTNLYNAVTGTGSPDVSGPDFPTTSTTTFAGSSSGVVGNLEGLMPAAPNVLPTSIDKDSSISFPLAFPFIGSQTLAIDLAVFSGPVAFIRGMCLSILAILFFLVSVRTIRSTFAS